MSTQASPPIEFEKLSLAQFMATAPVGMILVVVAGLFGSGFAAGTFIRTQIYEPELKRNVIIELEKTHGEKLSTLGEELTRLKKELGDTKLALDQEQKKRIPSSPPAAAAKNAAPEKVERNTIRELIALDGEPAYISTGNAFKVQDFDRSGNIRSTLSPSPFGSNQPVWSPPGSTWHVQDQGKACSLTYVNRLSSNSSKFILKCDA